jgi:hypothetical protein
MFMALFVPALVGALAAAMASFIGRALIALSIGFVTYTGISFAITAMKNTVISSINGLPADALNLVAYLWLDKGITIIFSAVAVSLAMRGIGGSVRRMVLK